MNQRFLLVTLCIFAITVVTCCRVPAQPHIPNDLENTFQELIPIDDMNKFFQIFVESSNQKKLEFESDISIVFRNLSDQQIFFPVGYGLRLLSAVGDEWVEIKNNNEYYGEGSLLLPENEKGAGRLVTWIRPVLPAEIVVDEGERVIVRIVVIGEFISNGERTGIPVAAYTDVFIFP